MSFISEKQEPAKIVCIVKNIVEKASTELRNTTIFNNAARARAYSLTLSQTLTLIAIEASTQLKTEKTNAI